MTADADPDVAGLRIVAPGKRLEVLSFAELRRLPAVPPSLWTGFLPLGSLTMLWGEAKTGKSTLIAGALKAIEDGGPFLGYPTTQATALWISEEPEQALREKAEAFGLFALGSSIAGSSRVFGLGWENLIEQAGHLAHKKKHKLLIVDTFTGLADLGPEEENDAGAIAHRLNPLRVAASTGLAVLFVHHTNKHGRKRPRGSGAFEGLVDNSIEFRRHGKSSRISVSSIGRYTATGEAHAVLTKTDGIWVYRLLGAGAAESRSESSTTEQRLVAALEGAGCDGLTYQQLGAVPGLSIDVAKKRMPLLLGEGVQAKGRGVKGDPLRYYLTGSC